MQIIIEYKSSHYHFRMYHRSQLVYPLDKHMLHSWLKMECQWPHTAENVSKDCWQDKGSDKFHSCKSIWEDSPCPRDTLVPQLQWLKMGKHMHYNRVRFLQLISNLYLNLRSRQAAYPSPIKGYLQVQVSLWSLAVQSAPIAQLPGLQRAWHSLRVKPLPGAKSQTSLVAHSLLLLQPAATQATRGLPCKPGGQTQMAVWKSTSHSALLPHWVVKQGFTHSCDLQALSKGQSLLVWHSSKNKRSVSLRCLFA